MGEVFEIHRKRRFTLEQARDLLPVVRRVTKQAQDEISKMTAQLSVMNATSNKSALEEQVQTRFRSWADKIQKLGCEAKGAWLVDFDSGEGYYCWRYPESTLEHFHGYEEGFGGRTRIQ